MRTRFYHPGGRTRLKHDARTIPVRGKGEDEGRYYKCWNCGFICDVKRDALGDAHSRTGMSSEFNFIDYSRLDPSERNRLSTLDVTDTGIHDGIPLMVMTMTRGRSVALKLGFDGEPIPIELQYRPKVVSGCPGCGCLNWRGDYR